ncbi:MAG: hypothetical protein AABP62_16645 [Planctomycetota bacterium]
MHGDLLLFRSDAEHPDLFPGFPSGSVGRLNQFIQSKEDSLTLTGSSLWYFTVILYTAAAICLWLTLRCFRRARGLLNAELSRE